MHTPKLEFQDPKGSKVKMTTKETEDSREGAIDIHQHVFWYGKTPKDLVEDMDIGSL